MASPPWKPKPLVLRVEIEPEHVEALGGLLSPGATGTPRLRAVEHDDPALVRREAALADREARLGEARRRAPGRARELERGHGFVQDPPGEPREAARRARDRPRHAQRAPRGARDGARRARGDV